ncbi:MAG TPA: substrate-binding domain-containing protein [Vicinamibacterales bacterium]|jgi:molybdate transport system substrate-binding protein|nr:substrate-binding domain-containing protein [Vicinamibacterales bacterium]
MIRFQLSILLVGLLLAPVRAASEDIVVMTSGTFTVAYLSLADTFAASSGDRFITAATKMGLGKESIPSRLGRGESVDIVIVASDALEQLTADGKIVRGSRLDLARSSIAMAVRQGVRRPDISSIAALKRTLLSARSVACSASVSGDYLVKELFPRLGIANEMRGKTLRIERESVGAVVARGEAEIGFQQVSELRPVPGIEIVGPLPGDAQRATVFSAGIAATSKHPDAARAFLAFLSSPAAQQVIEDTGLEPLHPR